MNRTIGTTRITPSTLKLWAALAPALVCAACSTMSGGSAPTVAVLPGGGKDMAAFNTDDIACRGDAQARASERSPVPAAMGLGRTEVASSRSRLAIRESTDTTTGSVYGGAPAADASTAFTLQQRYDTAYVQCMFSKGHKIPMKEQMSS